MRWLLPMLLMLPLVGCSLTKPRVISAPTELPVLEVPTRPSMQPMDAQDLKALQALRPETMAKLKANNDALQTYAITLEVTIQTYNAMAVLLNQRVRRLENAMLGVPDEPSARERE